MDAVHPQHNAVVAYGWIKRREKHTVPYNTGRRRVDNNGAIRLQRLDPVVRFDDTINAESTTALLRELEQVCALTTWTYVICDNARYYRAKAVKEYLKDSPVRLACPSPDAPTLNRIDRLWEFLKQQVPYNRYYDSFATFRQTCEAFFSNPRQYHHGLRSLLTKSSPLPVSEKAANLALPGYNCRIA